MRSHDLDISCVVFFFQAEDGIRDVAVTGVQTCALPISSNGKCGATHSNWRNEWARRRDDVLTPRTQQSCGWRLWRENRSRRSRGAWSGDSPQNGLMARPMAVFGESVKGANRC